MAVDLPIPAARYNQPEERVRNRILQNELSRRVETFTDIDTNRVILTSPNGTRYVLTVDDAGAITGVLL